MDTTGYEPGNVRHIDQQVCVNRIRDLPERRKIYLPGIGGSAGND